MCEDKKRFKLLVPNEESMSEFVLELIKEEADEINDNLEIGEGEVQLKVAYVSEVEDKIEVSLYIINNLESKVNFEKLPLALIKDGVEVGRQIFEAKEVGDIPGKTIKYNTIYFNKENVFTEDLSDIQVSFAQNLQYESKNTVGVGMANLPSAIKKNDLKVINEFMNTLTYLSVDTVDINTFSVFYDELKNLSIIIIIRNGYKVSVKLGALPIRVYDSSNDLVYAGIFTPKDINVEPDTATIQNIVVLEENVLIKNADLSKYRVEFK